jgi:hypothetical protein
MIGKYTYQCEDCLQQLVCICDEDKLNKFKQTIQNILKNICTKCGAQVIHEHNQINGELFPFGKSNSSLYLYCTNCNLDSQKDWLQSKLDCYKSLLNQCDDKNDYHRTQMDELITVINKYTVKLLELSK